MFFENYLFLKETFLSFFLQVQLDNHNNEEKLGIEDMNEWDIILMSDIEDAEGENENKSEKGNESESDSASSSSSSSSLSSDDEVDEEQDRDIEGIETRSYHFSSVRELY